MSNEEAIDILAEDNKFNTIPEKDIKITKEENIENNNNTEKEKEKEDNLKLKDRGIKKNKVDRKITSSHKSPNNKSKNTKLKNQSSNKKYNTNLKIDAENEKKTKNWRKINKDNNKSAYLKTEKHEEDKNKRKNVTTNNSKSKKRRAGSAEKRQNKGRILKTQLFPEELRSSKKVKSPKPIAVNINYGQKAFNQIEVPKDISRELGKKHQIQIDYDRKYSYLKKRIETLKIQETKIKMENKNIQKREEQKGITLANKEKQKNIMEKYKRDKINMMKNKKEMTKKQYEEENKVLKNYGNELSLRNRENYQKLKVEKEKLKEQEKKFDKQYLEEKKSKMLNVKNKKNENEITFKAVISDSENNNKVNYIYASKAIEELKHNCDELEKLEQEYIKRIEKNKQAKTQHNSRLGSAVKTNYKSKIKLNNNNTDEKNNENDKLNSGHKTSKNNKNKIKNMKPIENKIDTPRKDKKQEKKNQFTDNKKSKYNEKKVKTKDKNKKSKLNNEKKNKNEIKEKDINKSSNQDNINDNNEENINKNQDNNELNKENKEVKIDGENNEEIPLNQENKIELNIKSPTVEIKKEEEATKNENNIEGQTLEEKNQSQPQEEPKTKSIENDYQKENEAHIPQNELLQDIITKEANLMNNGENNIIEPTKVEKEDEPKEQTQIVTENVNANVNDDVNKPLVTLEQQIVKETPDMIDNNNGEAIAKNSKEGDANVITTDNNNYEENIQNNY